MKKIDSTIEKMTPICNWWGWKIFNRMVLALFIACAIKSFSKNDYFAWVWLLLAIGNIYFHWYKTWGKIKS